jgi:haloalkane dehalogenase
VVANGFLPTGDRSPGRAFQVWQAFARFSPVFPVGWIVQAGCRHRLGADVRAAYEAPFPTSEHAVAARAFPRLVPTRPDDPAAEANRRAWTVLERFEKPLVTAFGDKDPVFRGADAVLQKKVPGAAGQRHVTLPGGHFIQEDAPAALAQVVIDLAGRFR